MERRPSPGAGDKGAPNQSVRRPAPLAGPADERHLPSASLRLTSGPVMRVTPRRTPSTGRKAVFCTPMAATTGMTAAEEGHPARAIRTTAERQHPSRNRTAVYLHGRVKAEIMLAAVAAAAAQWLSLTPTPNEMLAPLMKDARSRRALCSRQHRQIRRPRSATRRRPPARTLRSSLACLTSHPLPPPQR